LRAFCNRINQLGLGHLGHHGFLCAGSERMESEGVTPGASLGTDAAKPRSSLLFVLTVFEVSRA
jgi:hypothetical protein